MKFKDIFNKQILFFDGAMGTMLQASGLKTGELPELLNLTHPEKIQEIHEEYLASGADIIKTNTFGANSLKMKNVCEVVNAGVNIAKKAADKFENKFVALDIGPSGKLIKPLGELEFEKAYELFKEVAVAGEKSGADLALIETFSNTAEIKAAVLAVKENTSLPIVVTMIFDERGRLLTGADIRCAVAMLEGLRVDAIGFNCGLGPEQMIALSGELFEISSTPIVFNPNAGLPVVINGKTQFNVSPDEFAEHQLVLAEKGAAMLGGCCGTTPAHIKALTEKCRNVPLKKISKKDITLVSSYSKAVQIGKAPVIIGERINPTGKKRFKQALRDNEIEYILREGITQAESGAHILDVNVGLPEIDEVKMMENVVYSLQEVTDVPLQIDTSDFTAMEKAMRIYNGKPMINSVNGKEESMESVFPLVQKYGGVVVALTLDENGIPKTAEERIKIAQKIINRAADYGIEKKDIIVDTLAMTISTDSSNAITTLDALRFIRNEMGVNTVLGVSNISFGLPQRENINSTFFTLALENGLSAGIINPMSADMMKAYMSFCALKGFDENCQKYIEKYSPAAEQEIKLSPQQDKAKNDVDLSQAIIKGLKDKAYECAIEMMKEHEPLQIINETLIPALDVVGKGFEQNTVFLPQLLMSAQAASNAFEAIKTELIKLGKEGEKGEKIVIATVKGDIHDIGKNIVKVLLENYGFDVIDLGKDVDPEKIVSTVIEQNVRLVGLSALMTTTVPSMEKTIKRLKESGADCKIMVGGAVLTQEYADMINADFYAKDAMASVNYATQFFKQSK